MEWCIAHPWMTFFIIMVLAESIIESVGAIITNEQKIKMVKAKGESKKDE